MRTLHSSNLLSADSLAWVKHTVREQVSSQFKSSSRSKTGQAHISYFLILF